MAEADFWSILKLEVCIYILKLTILKTRSDGYLQHVGYVITMHGGTLPRCAFTKIGGQAALAPPYLVRVCLG